MSAAPPLEPVMRRHWRSERPATTNMGLDAPAEGGSGEPPPHQTVRGHLDTQLRVQLLGAKVVLADVELEADRPEGARGALRGGVQGAAHALTPVPL
jgi:hypothetical protein